MCTDCTGRPHPFIHPWRHAHMYTNTNMYTHVAHIRLQQQQQQQQQPVVRRTAAACVYEVCCTALLPLASCLVSDCPSVNWATRRTQLPIIIIGPKCTIRISSYNLPYCTIRYTLARVCVHRILIHIHVCTDINNPDFRQRNTAKLLSINHVIQKGSLPASSPSSGFFSGERYRTSMTAY